jgi:hypothetical protein
MLPFTSVAACMCVAVSVMQHAKHLVLLRHMTLQLMLMLCTAVLPASVVCCAGAPPRWQPAAAGAAAV